MTPIRIGKNGCWRLLFAMLALGGLVILRIHCPLAGCEQPPQYLIQKTIHYQFVLKNKTNKTVRNARFLTFAPVQVTSSQKCMDINASQPFTMKNDLLGNQVMSFSFEQFPPYGTKIISIDAMLSMAEGPNCSDENIEPYLLSEPYVESDDESIIALCDTFDTKDPHRLPQELFDWVAQNIQYTGYRSDEIGAVKTLQTKKGDCTESARLFVALCRAKKIPARTMGGYVCDDNCNVSAVDYHNWAEFYLDGAWRVADPQKNMFINRQSHYVAMQVITQTSGTQGFRRYWVEGSGIEVKMSS